MQIGMMLSFYVWLSAYLPHFSVFQLVFSVGMILYLFNCQMDYSAKLTWLMVISLFPIPGTIFLWFTQKDIGHRAFGKRLSDLIHQTKNKIPQKQEILQRPEILQSGADSLQHYLSRSGCFPLYEHTQVKYFPSGEAKFSAMLKELKKAEKFIFMEYFIIEEGFMWGSILKILADKAKEGVEVRVMYDGMCEISLLSHDYPERMKKSGIQCKAFVPIQPFISTQYNYRDHRKILVIDGKTAFTGGVNLADEYINHIERFGHWKDTAIMLKGEAVSSFTLMFLQMWNITEVHTEFDYDSYLQTVPVPAKGYVMPYCDCPLDGEKVGKSVYLDILHRAKSYVHIMTPYLILDNELENALRFAAERGVDVQLILPGIPDKKAAYALAKSHYLSLIQSGVKIYEYTPGFVHAKVFVSDDEKAVVGTINMDYRSLYHHFECAAYLFQTECIPEIETDFHTTRKKCREVTLQSVQHETIFYKLTGAIMKTIAPLM